MKKPKAQVLVIGCGPAGMLAAHAVTLAGCNPMIASPVVEPSQVHGATYLHRPIPQLEMPTPERLRYMYVGTAEHYADKIYGPGFDPKLTSWGRFGSAETGWQMQAVYSSLWDRYGDLVLELDVKPEIVEDLCDDFFMVVNTAPLIKLVHERDRHHFRSEDVIVGPVPDDYEIEPFTIVYNGTVGSTWYRESNLWGIKAREYQLRNRVLGELGGDPNFPGPGRVVTKPVSVDNGLNPLPRVLKVGRYGSWNKMALADDAFFRTVAALESAG